MEPLSYQLPLPLFFGYFNQLGAGCSRRVLALDDNHVLKINAFRDFDTCMANQREADRWATADETERAILCPVVASDPDGCWLIMARATDIGKDWNYGRDDPYTDLVHTAHAHSLCDLWRANVGWYEGRPVMIDYAEARLEPIEESLPQPMSPS